MKKEDFKFGNVVELRDGDKYIYSIESTMLNLNGERTLSKTQYNERLIRNGNHDWDIMKVYEDYTLKKVLWERKDFVVSKDEKTILRIIPKTFKWIVRSYENILFLYEDKPQKTRYYWESSKGDVESIMVFNHLFEYIKWEDELPTLIEDLLKN